MTGASSGLVMPRLSNFLTAIARLGMRLEKR